MTTRYDADLGELRALLSDEPGYRVDQVWDGLYRRQVGPEEMTELPKALRGRLVEALPAALELSVERVSDDGETVKQLWRLRDGRAIESVLMRYRDRVTVCVSTQAGCAMGCGFCATGQAGFDRHLTTGEIVEQVIRASRRLAADDGGRVSNVVFMGMGEPLANLENVLRAIRIINAEWGLGIGARHITISTSGLAPQIRKLAEEPLQIRLAVSLHGATDEVRNRIMPINRRYNIETLLSACDYYKAHKKQRLTFEYILIADVNDSDEQARLLSRHAHRLSAKVNLIPYNRVSGLPWTRPSEKRQEKFLSILRDQGIPATLRREKGHDIDAACGQLRLQTEREAASKHVISKL